jgi:hypothetical protein
MYKEFKKQYKIPDDDCFDEKLSALYCEIKPLFGDDYPCVLRKIYTKINSNRK